MSRTRRQRNSWFSNLSLHKAAKEGWKCANYAIRQLLISNSANVDEKYNDGETPLHIAALRGHVQAVQLLILNNAHVNEKTHRGQTPLHYTAIGWHVQAAQLLISSNANVDGKNKFGQTPLHLAVFQQDNLPVARLMIDNNANIHEKDNDGRTPALYVQCTRPILLHTFVNLWSHLCDEHLKFLGIFN